MNSNPKLSYAIAAILSGAAPSLGLAAAATTDADTNSDSIQEITVTAQRRVESMQDVPISIQAITGAALEQLNVTTFEDFIKYLPNVTAESAGPGQSSIFMRGVSSGVTGEQGTGTTGPIPNVAVYLDEQSGALPGRNLDVYAADLEHIDSIVTSLALQTEGPDPNPIITPVAAVNFASTTMVTMDHLAAVRVLLDPTVPNTVRL